MAHRKTDVDLDDEDAFQEVKIQVDYQQIQEVLAQARIPDATKALSILLQILPHTPEQLQAVYDLLGRADISKLDQEQGYTLMTYLYQLMSKPQYSGSLVLQVHEKAVEQFGLGSIVRVMTSRSQ